MALELLQTACHLFVFQHWLDPTKAIKKQVKSKCLGARECGEDIPCFYQIGHVALLSVLHVACGEFGSF
jgi:hypothetical protein